MPGSNTPHLHQTVTNPSQAGWNQLIASEHAKWLRDERLKAYAGLSLAAEEALQFIRSDMPALISPDSTGRRDTTEARWRELRTELRKAYNQVALFGADEARTVGVRVWRIARDGGNDFLHNLDSRGHTATARPDLSEQIRLSHRNLEPPAKASWRPAGRTCKEADPAPCPASVASAG